MSPIQHFKFCPQCGVRLSAPLTSAVLHCDACGFHLYFNPAIAAAAFVVRADRAVLFIRRARDPAKGKLALPGGFIDAGETAEVALRREIREEVGLEVGSIHYLYSGPNVYPYRGVTYTVLDLFFVAQALHPEQARALDAVEAVCWLDPAPLDPAELAFPSMIAALECYRAKPA
jgi:ADP-ribose pyrophosphatase YjhB (NUDIX family)